MFLLGINVLYEILKFEFNFLKDFKYINIIYVWYYYISYSLNNVFFGLYIIEVIN